MKRGKSISDWMSSALTRDRGASQPPPPPQRRKRLPSKTEAHKRPPSKPDTHRHGTTAGPQSEETDVPWSLKYQPQTASDLAVHKKKVTEVQQWLEFALSPRARHPILLLTGPPGCGKTATLQAISRDMGFSILEWVNPGTEGERQDEVRRPGDIILYPESQWKQFHNFLVRANRYPCLQMGVAGGRGQPEGQRKKVVLVEEFPNTFIRDPSRFHDIMSSLTPTLHYPLVFIVSESHRGESSTSSIFTKTALATSDILTISFNPIAHTSLVKTLQKIATAECQRTGATKKSSSRGQKVMPPKEVLESLAESSAGDIRSAINALQFACLKDPSDLLSTSEEGHLPAQKPLKRETSRARLKKQSSSEAGLCAIGGRDSSLFLFRALGKILYCKREPAPASGDEDPSHSLPGHLKKHERLPLLVNPEAVVEHTHMSSEMFILYLHQNYIDFYEDLDDIVRTRGVEYLSDADILGRMWTDSSEARASLLGYSSSVTCRGLMHSNNRLKHSSTTGGKWRPLHKPQWNTIRKQYHENCRAARGLFLHLGSSPHAHLWTPIELQTELLPYLGMINIPLRNPGQVALLQSITHFTSGHHRSRQETLGERDIEAPETTPTQEPDEGRAHPSVQGTGSAQSLSQGSAADSWSQDAQMGGEKEDSDCDIIEDFEDDVIW